MLRYMRKVLIHMISCFINGWQCGYSLSYFLLNCDLVRLKGGRRHQHPDLVQEQREFCFKPLAWQRATVSSYSQTCVHLLWTDSFLLPILTPTKEQKLKCLKRHIDDSVCYR